MEHFAKLTEPIILILNLRKLPKLRSFQVTLLQRLGTLNAVLFLTRHADLLNVVRLGFHQIIGLGTSLIYVRKRYPRKIQYFS